MSAAFASEAFTSSRALPEDHAKAVQLARVALPDHGRPSGAGFRRP